MDVVHCSNRVKAAAKVSAEYHHVVDKVKEERGRTVQESKKAPIIPITAHLGSQPPLGEKPQPVRDGELPPISISTEVQQFNEEKQNSLVETMLDDLPVAKKARSSHSDESSGGTHFSQALMVQQEVPGMEMPSWHAPWKMMRVLAGHQGHVRSVTVEPGNEWFATGAADKTIKLWNLASGELKLTLTGHTSTVHGLVVSEQSPYLFSVGEDKTVRRWDLEFNRVDRYYHGHLSGVFCVNLLPLHSTELLVTGGRDATVRVWDIRQAKEVLVLGGHTNQVNDVQTQIAHPHIISSSMDLSVRTWDLTAGKVASILTHHSKAPRSLVLHPTEWSMVSLASDNIKKWLFPDCTFLQNISGHHSILNAGAVNQDDVLVSGGDNGSLCLWDWTTGYCFQRMNTVAQPGSLTSEAGIFAMTFDKTGSRLITAEADKTIKIWKEDEAATPQSHPVTYVPKPAEK